MDWFFHLKQQDEKDVNSIEWNLAIFHDEGRISRDLLPIARDAGGNLMCIGIQGDRYGNIYFWDHELEDEEDLDAALIFVSPGFDEWLNSFTEIDMTLVNAFVCITRKDYDTLAQLFANSLSPNYKLEEHRMNFLEYSAFYHDPDLTDFLLKQGARENIMHAAEIAAQRGNTKSLAIINSYLEKEG